MNLPWEDSSVPQGNSSLVSPDLPTQLYPRPVSHCCRVVFFQLLIGTHSEPSHHLREFTNVFLMTEQTGEENIKVHLSSEKYYYLKLLIIFSPIYFCVCSVPWLNGKSCCIYSSPTRLKTLPQRKIVRGELENKKIAILALEYQEQGV